jgi:hypothetical protein
MPRNHNGFSRFFCKLTHYLKFSLRTAKFRRQAEMNFAAVPMAAVHIRTAWLSVEGSALFFLKRESKADPLPRCHIARIALLIEWQR